jgi:hypothetical protein
MIALICATLLGAAVDTTPLFTDYPAEKFAGTPASPVLDSAEARRFRTLIRQKAAAGPNFAGHYTIATWGCGSTCVGFAVVDAKTGSVVFHPSVRRVMQVPYQVDNVLRFRVDSRLLVMAGETEGPDGASRIGRFAYELKDGRFVPIGESQIRLEFISQRLVHAGASPALQALAK